jgi:hypothetical protein
MEGPIPTRTTEAAVADQRADSRFADALRSNHRGDNYTILTGCSRWSFPLLLRQRSWAVRALKGSCSDWRSRFWS